jgi:uncharacterized protein (TIGR02246 family)
MAHSHIQMPDRRPLHLEGNLDGASLGLPRSVVRLTVMLAALGAACSDGTVATTDPLPPTHASAAIGATPNQTDAVAELVAAATAAWAAKDAAAYAAIYSEDVVFINPVGAFLSGRDAVRQQHTFLFSGPFAGSTLGITVRRVQFLTGTIAIVDQNDALTGYAFLPPSGLRATEPGVVRTIVRWVIEKRGGTWEIIAQQMTLVPPAL